MYHRSGLLAAIMFLSAAQGMAGEHPSSIASSWPQWRGPTREGKVYGPPWPDRLRASQLERLWRLSLGPSYSGPVLSNELVFTTETRDQRDEVVHAIDRRSGASRWRAEWKGAMTVPFFALANGSWIRSTPAYDGASLYVAGMRDVLVCLDARSGKERWRVDFVEKLRTPLPAFGFVCSPLVDESYVYVQAGASCVKLRKDDGTMVWRTLEDGGGMYGSAFSSPMIASLGGRRQLLVQTREKLCGVDLDDGRVLWSQQVPNFRGMNILTPTVYGDAVFTSSYQQKSWLYRIAAQDDGFRVDEVWSQPANGYMSTPVVIGEFAYLHLQNQRFTCIDLRTGKLQWTSKPFGKYCSLVANGDRILALDNRGRLLYFRANPMSFELLDDIKISDEDTWAHLAVSGQELYIRELHALSAYRWKDSPTE